MAISNIKGPFRPSLEKMGQRAYEAFERANGFSPCVEWHTLPLYRRNAWIDAAAAAVGEDQMQREAERCSVKVVDGERVEHHGPGCSRSK